MRVLFSFNIVMLMETDYVVTSHKQNIKNDQDVTKIFAG